MLRFAVLMATAALAFAQQPAEKPPEGVEEALRARMQEFYHYFETEEYRKAEKLVAEDSQDWFYNHNKPHYLSAKIQTITWFDHFTRATAVVLCEQYVMFPGFAGKPMQIPTTSTWKLVNGQWYWYVDPSEERRTPFGMIPERPNQPAKPGALPASIPTTADFALNLVKPDVKALELKPGESAQVTFTNTAKGLMMLSVKELPDGVDATFDRGQINAGEKGVLTVKAAKGSRGGTVMVHIIPTNETVPIAVTVK